MVNYRCVRKSRWRGRPEAELANARREAERARSLSRSSATSRAALDSAELAVRVGDANLVAARAREEFRPCWLCARSFVAENERGDANYRVRTSECGTSQGNNCCAPSCFNQSYVVDVFDPEEDHVVARSANVWPGCNCAGATERSNIVLRFPKNATDRERASLVAATVLVEFAHFEWKKNDNEAGGPAAMFI